jgi:hypothetical protein
VEKFSEGLSARDVSGLFIFVVTAIGGMSIVAGSALRRAAVRNAGYIADIIAAVRKV